VTDPAAPTIHGDQSLAFLADGYRFGMRRFDRLGVDAFRTRLMLKPVTFLRGRDATRFFYEGGRFQRMGALPRSVVHSLQDVGSVQTLEGAAHRARKALFVDIITDDSVANLVDEFRGEWLDALPRWAAHDRVNLHLEVGKLLTAAVCRWAGVPLDAAERDARSREFLAMIEYAGAFGPPNWYGRALRLRTEAWARAVLARPAPAGSPIGQLQSAGLDIDVAAIELINLLRPTVAIGRYVVHTAWALRRHPEWAARIAESEEHVHVFVQEVRRFAPFFPVVGGRATRELEWNGLRFEEGDWVMLDLFATNRHPGLWEQPERFDPRRFIAHAPDHNAFVPQGGGDRAADHRCPGENPTIEIMAEAARLLTRSMSYRVPPQDLRISLRRMPSLPQSGFDVSEVAAVG
jgi:fatty-acid peroxygenase